MAAVSVTRGADGYAVSRIFRSLPAAMRGVDELLKVADQAFEPVAAPAATVADPAALRLAAAIEAAEADDMEPHDGRLVLPVSNDEE